MAQFNKTFSLAQNIRGGLWANAKSIADVAKTLNISEQTVRVSISRKFLRNSKITPQDQKIVNYLKEHCEGFKEWASNNLQLDS